MKKIKKNSNPEKFVNSLLKASRAILEHSEFEKSARVIFDEARKMTGAVSGYVALLNEDGSENELLFLESGGLECTVDPSLPMPIRGLRSECYHKKEVVYDNNFMDSKWEKFMPEGHVILRNVLFSPLILNDVAVGLIGLANKPGDFNEEDARFAKAFGEYAAIALKNAKNIEHLNTTIEKLEKALKEVKELKGLLPICSKCKKIRDDEGYWNQVENYISERTDTQFSHGYCPECLEEEIKRVEKDVEKNHKDEKNKN